MAHCFQTEFGMQSRSEDPHRLLFIGRPGKGASGLWPTYLISLLEALMCCRVSVNENQQTTNW